MKNNTFHNLCSISQPPKGLGKTLGLGLKFCIQSPTPNQNPDYTRLQQDIRKKFYFAGNDDTNDIIEPCPKRLYIKSKWVPDPQCENLENKINNFILNLELQNKLHLNLSKKSTNLNNIQKQHINFLRQNTEFIILMCDKNLGPAIIERGEYIRLSLKEHLLNKQNYTQLQPTEAEHLLMKMKDDTCSLFVEHANKLSKHEIKYFRNFILKLPTSLRIPQYYGMPKVHKQKIPIPLRPVVSQCGSYTAFISTWIDNKLQPLKHFLPSYIKNSQDLLDIIDTLPPLPPNAKIVTTDAVSMYSNISTKEGIHNITTYLNKFSSESDRHFPIDLVCSLLEVVMQNNIFKFGTTWWQQLDGTAMGTPCACIYATLFFGLHERQLLLTKYKENLLLYKRQIDDIFIVWVPTSPNNIEWTHFVQDLNCCSSLSWETETLDNKTHFLDLNLWIDSSTRKINYSTYQKPMNLFLYIPNHSAHPTNTIQSLIYGLLQTYKRQNPNPLHFRNLTKLL